MKRNNLFSKILGWCPGFQAAAGFQERPLSSKLEGLSLLVIAWLAGLWLVLNTARGLTGMDLTLFTNRATLLLLLGSIVIIGYTWKSFKPRNMNLEEFPIRSTSIDDLPDVPVAASMIWLSRGTGTSPSMGYTVGSAGGPDIYKPGEARFYDSEEYRRKIQYYKDLKKRRDEKNESKENE
ncbi:MAG: hypothetical protein V1924_07095 [Candidatus Bathyarchaeota archaeon]